MTRALSAVAALLLAAACAGKDSDPDSSAPDSGDSGDTDTHDEDGDGFDDEAFGGTDCDDSDATVHPTADEHCDDRDEDCDGNVDENPLDAPSWYLDADDDGYGIPGSVLQACDEPDGRADNDDDCDDADPLTHPGAAEEDCADPHDYNCDGSSTYADVDDDGWPACEDCADDDDTRHPDAVEHCDDIDEDCDGTADDDAIDAVDWYEDSDGDGHGTLIVAAHDCDAPADTSAVDDDCDDLDDTIHPGADEHCDAIDQDCDGDVADDESVDAPTWYPDTDTDGYGDEDAGADSCEAPTDWIDVGGDCDDTDLAVHPDATEGCNFADDDCDGLRDEDCPEICDDSFDNDGDDLADCADEEDCALVCPEDDCADGLDDDEDSLVDCEDGDCSSSLDCQEDCGDGTDNDLDGLTDCKDDDCWGPDCHPGGPLARVKGGNFAHVGSYFTSRFASCSSAGSVRFSQHRVSGSGIWGTVRVLPGASTFWSTATTWDTCTWSVATMDFSSQRTYGDVAAYIDQGPVNRLGFAVTPGCGLSTSAFLPQVLTADADGLFAKERSVLWYQGGITFHDKTASTWKSTTSCWYGTGIANYTSITRTETWEVTNSTGSAYESYP